jgi:hypothetical protein
MDEGLISRRWPGGDWNVFRVVANDAMFDVMCVG